MDDEYLTPEEVAEILRVEVQTLYSWRYLKKGPPSFKLDGSQANSKAPVRYRRSELQAWIKEQESGERASA